MPYVIYGDFETMPMPIDGCEKDSNTFYTERKQDHIPCGYSYTVLRLDSQHCKPAIVYLGDSVVDNVVDNMLKEKSTILKQLKEVTPMKLSTEQWRDFYTAKRCHSYDKSLD